MYRFTGSWNLPNRFPMFIWLQDCHQMASRYQWKLLNWLLDWDKHSNVEHSGALCNHKNVIMQSLRGRNEIFQLFPLVNLFRFWNPLHSPLTSTTSGSQVTTNLNFIWRATCSEEGSVAGSPLKYLKKENHNFGMKTVATMASSTTPPTNKSNILKYHLFF